MDGLGTKQIWEAANTTSSEWIAGPLAPAISNREVHVWKVGLRGGASEAMYSWLSDEEQNRAARFHFGKDRESYQNAHGSLRLILGRYLDLAPAELHFGQTDFGKPFLTNNEASGLLFNMSHSGDFALIAVTREREVGVDVEFMRDGFATDDVAEHFFSVAEIYTLTGLEPHLRTHAFFNCWTRKEAYVKARGEGLSMPLDQFDVSLAPGVQATMLNNRLDEMETSRWTFHDLTVAPEYAGALAVESLSSPATVSCYSLAP
jgi:4'-phosphopantetheinyl transferase